MYSSDHKTLFYIRYTHIKKKISESVIGAGSIILLFRNSRAHIWLYYPSSKCACGNNYFFRAGSDSENGFCSWAVSDYYCHQIIGHHFNQLEREIFFLALWWVEFFTPTSFSRGHQRVISWRSGQLPTSKIIIIIIMPRLYSVGASEAAFCLIIF